MKKFKFKLEQVLGFRMTVKAEKKRVLMQKNLLLQEAERRLEEIEREFRSQALPEQAVLRAEELQTRAAYSLHLKMLIEQQHLTIIRLRDEVAKALEVYIEAAKDANALETLKERRRAEYLERVAKEEERILDEMAVQRAGRQSALGK